MSQLDRARQFRALHVPGNPVVLPNAWDVISARIVESSGAQAVATTSAGVAWSLGSADGNRLAASHAIDAIARIAAAVRVPVTADIERGFAEDLSSLEENVRGVIAAGVVGVNIEDGLRPIIDQVEWISRARAAADNTGIPVFLNARIDTHSLVSDREHWLDETVERARAYTAAGADGILVLGALDATTIRTLVDRVSVPVNVAFGPDTLTVAELADTGAARISAGSTIAEAAYGVVDHAAREMLTHGTAGTLTSRRSWTSLNALLL